MFCALLIWPAISQAGSLTIGLDYKRPTNAVVGEFRDAPAWKEGTPADAQASAADFHNVLLSVQAEVAQHHFNLRAIDRQRVVVRPSIRLRREARESQRTLLVVELDAAKVLGLRQVTAIQLIKALGGGWTSQELTDKK